MNSRVRRSTLAVVALLAVIEQACTTSPIHLPKPPRVRPSGLILGVLASPGQGLFEFRFTANQTANVPLPEKVEGAFFQGMPSSTFAVVQSRDGSSRLVKVTSGGQIEHISPPITSTVHSEGPPADDRLLLTSCPGAGPPSIVNLSGGSMTSLPEVRGCPVALSPDGSSIAFSPDLATVWSASSTGQGPPRLLLRLQGHRQLQAVGVRDPRVIAVVGMAWSSSGLALAVEGTGRSACVVIEPNGRLLVIPLGAARPLQLAWNRAGSLLAFIEHDRLGDALRVVDPRSRRLRLASLALGKPLRGLVWSPTGNVIVTLEGTDHWVVVTPNGSRIRSMKVPPGTVPVDWTG